MHDKPKRRWYQFSLRSMLVLMLALGLGFGGYTAWQRHRHYCISQCYRLMDDVAEDGGFAFSLQETEEPCSPDELRELEAVNQQRDKVAREYVSAIYQPWERFWMSREPRPPKRPARFAERLRTSRNADDRDRQLRALERRTQRQPRPSYYPTDPPTE